MLGGLTAGSGAFGQALTVEQQLPNRFGEGLRIAFCAQGAGLVLFNEFREAGIVGRDHRNATGHCFDHVLAKRLAVQKQVLERKLAREQAQLDAIQDKTEPSPSP